MTLAGLVFSSAALLARAPTPPKASRKRPRSASGPELSWAVGSWLGAEWKPDQDDYGPGHSFLEILWDAPAPAPSSRPASVRSPDAVRDRLALIAWCVQQQRLQTGKVPGACAP